MIRTAYDHIKSNNIKTAILVLLFPIILIGLIFSLVLIVSDINTALQTAVNVFIPTFIVSIIWMFLSYSFGDSMILNMANAIKCDSKNKEYKTIFNILENLSISCGLPTPNLYIIESNALNAFATGRSPKDASVVLTTGIIKKLDKLELEGVIAHELGHINNRDIRLDMLIVTGIGITVFIADFLLRANLYKRNNNNKDNSGAIILMVWLAFTIFNFIITPLLRMAISRKREFTADAFSAKLTKNPKALSSALKKISENPAIETLDKSLSAMCIAEPKELVSDLLATHPPIKERIKRLNRM